MALTFGYHQLTLAIFTILIFEYISTLCVSFFSRACHHPLTLAISSDNEVGLSSELHLGMELLKRSSGHLGEIHLAEQTSLRMDKASFRHCMLISSGSYTGGVLTVD